MGIKLNDSPCEEVQQVEQRVHIIQEGRMVGGSDDSGREQWGTIGDGRSGWLSMRMLEVVIGSPNALHAFNELMTSRYI